MSHRARVRMWLEIGGERRTIDVLASAVGQHSAAGWQVDDTPPPPPPAPRPTRRRKPKPAPRPATGGAGEPDPTTEQE